MSNVVSINELQAFYFEMKDKLSEKTNELKEAENAITDMNFRKEEFSI